MVAALDFIAGLPQVDSDRLVVAGYSFGCWVGLKAACKDPRPRIMVGISPPVDMYDFSFLNGETRPKLLLAGDADFVCSTTAFLRLVDEVPEPKKWIVLPHTDHFHFGSEARLSTHVAEFLIGEFGKTRS